MLTNQFQLTQDLINLKSNWLTFNWFDFPMVWIVINSCFNWFNYHSIDLKQFKFQLTQFQFTSISIWYSFNRFETISIPVDSNLLNSDSIWFPSKSALLVPIDFNGIPFKFYFDKLKTTTFQIKNKLKYHLFINSHWFNFNIILYNI